MRLRVKRLHPDAQLPTQGHPYDAGYDLYAVETHKLFPGETFAVDTGLAIQVPVGYGGLVFSRSGLAKKNSIHVLNAPGLIDPGYTGEISVILHNSDPTFTHTIEKGDRIAQLVVQKVETLDFDEVAELESIGSRGQGGFGSTGIKGLSQSTSRKIDPLKYLQNGV